MLEAHAEKDLAVLGLELTDAARAGEGVDLQLEDRRGKDLIRGTEEG